MIRGAPALAALALFLSAAPALRADAQPPGGPSGTDGAPQAVEQPSSDAWDFPDEAEDAPSATEDLRAQAADLAMFAAFAGLALVSFFRKSERLKYVTLAASVVYLGFVKSQLISIANVYGLLTMNLPVFRYSLAWYLFAAFTVVSTVLWGRLYCGRICAFGALTQLMDRVVPARLRLELPRRIEDRAAWVKYGLLAGILGYFLVTGHLAAYRYVEPFWMFSLQATTGLWVALGVLLVATVFVRNLYCRFLCPLGAALGLLSKLTVFRIKRWSECNTCKICEKTCEWGAIRGPEIVVSECVRCDDCERLYMDTQKCPHWLLIIRKKSDVMARQPAAPVS